MTGRFAPAHAAHSIDHVNATLAFDERLSGSEWLQVFIKAQECANNLGLSVYADVVGGLTQTAQPPHNSRESPQFSLIVSAIGSSFSRIDENGVTLQKLTIARTGIAFESQTYVRWSSFAEIWHYLLQSLLPLCPENINITQTRLEYRDRYIQSASISYEGPTWSQVLRKGSIISDINLDRPEPWHQHSGWLATDSAQARRLVNLNIDTTIDTTESGELIRTIFIYSLIAGAGAYSAPETVNCLIGEFEALHRQSKVVLGSILTDDMQRSISLQNNEQEK